MDRSFVGGIRFSPTRWLSTPHWRSLWNSLTFRSMLYLSFLVVRLERYSDGSSPDIVSTRRIESDIGVYSVHFVSITRHFKVGCQSRWKIAYIGPLMEAHVSDVSYHLSQPGPTSSGRRAINHHSHLRSAWNILPSPPSAWSSQKSLQPVSIQSSLWDELNFQWSIEAFLQWRIHRCTLPGLKRGASCKPLLNQL